MPPAAGLGLLGVPGLQSLVGLGQLAGQATAGPGPGVQAVSALPGLMGLGQLARQAAAAPDPASGEGSGSRQKAMPGSGRSTPRRRLHVEAAVRADDDSADTSASDDEFLVKPTAAAKGGRHYTKVMVKVSHSGGLREPSNPTC